MDGRHPHEGRVEVCLNETWGKICDHISIYGWNKTEAEVVCKQLGYSKASEDREKNMHLHKLCCVFLVASAHDFGMGSVPVTIINPRCRGTESSLTECVYSNAQNVCSRSQHGIVGIQCTQG